MTNVKRSIGSFLSVALVGMFLGGCGSSSNTVVVNPVPDTNQRIMITTDNIDAILATSVSGIDKLANLVDGVVDKLPTVKSKSRSLLDIDLATRDCAVSGSITVDKVTTSGATLSFNQCQEDNSLLDGVAAIDKSGDTYDASFTNFSVTTKGDTVNLVSATAHIVGNDYEFFIASGSATVDGAQLEVQNFTLKKTGQEAIANGALFSSCIGGWIDVSTQKPLLYDTNGQLVGGELLISGNNSTINVTVNSDGSIVVHLNGELYKNYASVDDLPQFSELCAATL